jgi:hypothetical protein
VYKKGNKDVSSFWKLKQEALDPTTGEHISEKSIDLSQDSVKDKAIPLQALKTPECSRKLRLPDFMTIGT